MSRATVLGGNGYIGSHLAARLRRTGLECEIPARDAPLDGRDLGTVFYCVGLTADFRRRPFATIDAHIGLLRQVLEHGRFDRLVYLSSTRVYAGLSAADEDQILQALPARADDLYNLSKMTGESLALSCGAPCTVARLSNVIGPGMGPKNFLGAVIDEACRSGAVRFDTAPGSRKDYLWIDDAVSGLIAIATRGKAMVYNLASGTAVTHEAIAALLASRGIRVSFSAGAPLTTFPEIPITRLVHDTGFQPGPLHPRLEAWLDQALAAGNAGATRNDHH